MGSRGTQFVPDKVYTLRAAGVDHGAEVLNQFGHPVIPAASRSGAAGVTPLVRGQTAGALPR